MLRTSIYNVAAALPLTSIGPSRLQQIALGIKASGKLLIRLAAGSRQDLLAKSFRSALRGKQGDRFLDVYFDGILARHPSSLKLEVVNSTAFNQQAAQALRPAELDAYAFTFWGVVLGRLFPRKEAWDFCNRVSAALQHEVGIEVGATFMMRRLSALYWESRLYALLLARVRPRVVMVADTSEYALRRACAVRNIPFVEMQHGVFDADHPDAVPAWVQGTTQELLLPDVLACYGQFWIDRLAGTRQSSHHIVAVGNDWVDRFRAIAAQHHPPGIVRLLFTSQGMNTKAAVAWLADALAHVPEGVTASLTIKLHPAYLADADAFSTLVQQFGAKIVAGGDLPNVWDLLSQTDLHLSISSACHFDAVALGVPTVVMPLPGQHLMARAIDQRSIFKAGSPSDIWSVLARDNCRAGVQPERFVAPGFLDNVDRLIKTISDPSRRSDMLQAVGEPQ